MKHDPGGDLRMWLITGIRFAFGLLAFVAGCAVLWATDHGWQPQSGAELLFALPLALWAIAILAVVVLYAVALAGWLVCLPLACLWQVGKACWRVVGGSKDRGIAGI